MLNKNKLCYTMHRATTHHTFIQEPIHNTLLNTRSYNNSRTLHSLIRYKYSYNASTIPW